MKCVCLCFFFRRALSSVSVRTATLESSVRSLTPASTGLVTTTAPALMCETGRGGPQLHMQLHFRCVSVHVYLIPSVEIYSYTCCQA